MEFVIKGKPKTIEKKAHDLINRGKKVRFEDGEFEISGSELFADCSGPVELQFCSTRSGAITLVLRDEQMSEIARLNQVAGVYTCGTTEASFESTTTGAPLQLSATSIDANGATFSLRFVLEKWDGLPILLLPHFDTHREFLESFGTSSFLNVEYFVEGNKVPLKCEASEVNKLSSGKDESHSLKLQGPLTAVILDEKIELGEVIHEYTHMKMVVPRKLRTNSKLITVHALGNSETIFTLKKTDE